MLTEWDPIGIEHASACADEYDSYIGGAIGLLMHKSTDAELTDYFRQIETENMGITPCEAAIEKQGLKSDSASNRLAKLTLR